MAEVFRSSRHLDLPRLSADRGHRLAGMDLVFCALPHATSQAVMAKLPRDLKIVDLSADFRLRDPTPTRSGTASPTRHPICRPRRSMA
jgi:N-acetyl-gamma-glutamyl-phosphate reductase